MKTELYLYFSNDCIRYTAKEMHQESFLDENGNEKEKEVRKQIYKSDIKRVIGTCDNATSLFSAVCDAYAPKFAYVALKTIYANEPSSKIYELMTECIMIAKDNPNVKESFELLLSDSGNNYIDSYMTAKQVANKSYLAKQRMYSHERQSYIRKEHTYKIETLPNGTKQRIEIIPYSTQEKTQYGKVIDSVFEYDTNLDCYDVIYTAKLAICELLAYGLIDSPSDIWKYKSYVYRRVNRYIYSRRAVRANESEYTLFTDKNGKQVIKSISYTDKKLARVDKNIIIDLVADYIRKNISKRANVDNVLKTYELIYRKNQTTRQVAKILNTSHVQVVKYNKLIIKAIQTLGKEDYNALFDALTDCIND